jgi:hypothetical protein
VNSLKHKKKKRLEPGTFIWTRTKKGGWNVEKLHQKRVKELPWNPKRHPDCFSLMAYCSDGMPEIARHPVSRRPWHLIDIDWKERKSTTPEFRRKHRIWFGTLSGCTVLGNNRAREIFREFKKIQARVKKGRKRLRELYNEIEKMSVYNQFAKLQNKKEKELGEY